MPALNFQRRFAELVKTGQKRQTIRAYGFQNVTEMLQWCERTHGLPFIGLVIYWEDLR